MPTLSVPDWLVTVGASTASAVGGFILALINRGPAMQSAIDERVKTLIDGYEKRIDDLMTEVKDLRKEVISLRKALDAAKDDREGCIKSTTCENAVPR